MATVKHASRIREVSKNASRNSIVYTGSMEEMRQIQSSNGINSINAEIGRITSSRVYQEGGTIWCCELVAELSSDGTATTGPDTSYGKKSASLHGTMLSMPLDYIWWSSRVGGPKGWHRLRLTHLHHLAAREDRT